ncbi:unnamed protein product [Caenorhabditis sp. 36 PRJEB53466]|nr:unnamed protein product [Caenorhabditis sp. 36 PRJEB53466]
MNGNHEKLPEEHGPGPSIHAAFVFDHFTTGVEMMRCSMPSLSKMPSAARQLVSNMLSFLSSPSPQSRSVILPSAAFRCSH